MMRRLHPRASELQQKIPVSTARVDEISVTDSRENYDCPIASQMGGDMTSTMCCLSVYLCTCWVPVEPPDFSKLRMFNFLEYNR